MRTRLVVPFLFGAMLAWAGPPPKSKGAQPMPPTHAPTAYACTVKTLQSGEECYFESNGPNADGKVDAAKQGQENVAFLKKLAEPVCGAATKREPGKPAPELTTKKCAQGFHAVAADCSLEGAVAIVDGEGRFHPRARACYEALGNVLADAHTAAGAAPSCCECLARTSCKVEPTKCNKGLDKAQLAGALKSCVSECDVECAVFAGTPAKKDTLGKDE